MTNSFQTWLNDQRLADAVLAAALGFLLLIALGVRVRRGTRWPELLGTAVFGVYLIGLAMVVLSPLPGLSPPAAPAWPAGVVWPTAEVTPVAPDPPHVLISLTLDLHGFLRGGLTNQNVQNILLTVPFGFGLPFVLHRRSWRLVLACLALPVALEGGQALASLVVGWAYRSVDINDYLTNAGGGLLGLSLFTWVAWLLSRTRVWPPPRRVAGRRVTSLHAAATAVAVLAVAVPLWCLAPEESIDYATACQGTPPADAVHPLPDWTAYTENRQVCLSYPGGSTVAEAGSTDIVLEPDAKGQVTVVGQAPAQSDRVRVTLPDGRGTDAELHPLNGLTGWLTYAARFEPVRRTGTATTATIDPATVKVESFTADGSRLRS